MAVDSLKAKPLALAQMRSPQDQDAKLKGAAKMYEKQFLGEMMKAMRGTVQESGLVKVSQAEKIFRDQLDGEYVDHWADKGGLGLQDIIYKQLIDKYGERLGIKAPVERPRGPVPLGENSNFTGRVIPTAGQNKNSERMTFEFSRQFSESNELQEPGLAAGLRANSLKAPWDGVLGGIQKLGSDDYAMKIKHDNGLESRFVFRGLPSLGAEGAAVQAGQTIGVLSPESNQFFWNVENGPKSVSE